jgi:hypothetical protein
MNTKIKYKNFVLYGSQTGEVNDSIYRQLLQKIQKPQTTSSIQFLNANPLNLEETIQKLKEPTYFFPLFLMKGIEYSNFTSSIQKIFALKT